MKLGTTWFKFSIAVFQIPKYVELSLCVVRIPRWCLVIVVSDLISRVSYGNFFIIRW